MTTKAPGQARPSVFSVCVKGLKEENLDITMRMNGVLVDELKRADYGIGISGCSTGM